MLFACYTSKGKSTTCKHDRDSRVAHAASTEVGNLHDKTVPQRLLAAAEDKLKVIWAEFKQGVYSSSSKTEESSDNDSDSTPTIKTLIHIALKAFFVLWRSSYLIFQESKGPPTNNKSFQKGS